MAQLVTGHGLPVGQRQQLGVLFTFLLRAGKKVIFKCCHFFHDFRVSCPGLIQQLREGPAAGAPVAFQIFTEILDRLHIVISQNQGVFPRFCANSELLVGFDHRPAIPYPVLLARLQLLRSPVFHIGALVQNTAAGIQPVQIAQSDLSLEPAQAHGIDIMAGGNHMEAAPLDPVVVTMALEHILCAAGEPGRTFILTKGHRLIGIIHAKLTGKTKVNSAIVLLAIHRFQPIAHVGHRPGQYIQIVQQQGTCKGQLQTDLFVFKGILGRHGTDGHICLGQLVITAVVAVVNRVNCAQKLIQKSVQVQYACDRLAHTGPVAGSIIRQPVCRAPQAEHRVIGNQRNCRCPKILHIITSILL